MRTPTAADIHAKRAFDGTSWSPERREQGAINSYLSDMAAVRDEFEQWRTPENSDQMDEDLEYYRERYAAKYNAYLHAHSRVVSQMITGSGGWTGRMVRANQKRNDSCDNRMREFLDWEKKQLDRMRRRYNPRLMNRVISSGDPLAIEKLQDKIEKAEALQEIMKQANAIIRKTKLSDDEKINELVELEGISEADARKLLQPDFMKRLGFPSFALTNNNANIRRMKERIEELQRKKEVLDARDGDLTITYDVVEYVENKLEDRVQLIFDGKPSAEVRALCKRWGFRWSPTQGAWQRHLNGNGQYAAKQVIKELGAKPVETTEIAEEQA